MAPTRPRIIWAWSPLGQLRARYMAEQIAREEVTPRLCVGAKKLRHAAARGDESWSYIAVIAPLTAQRAIARRLLEAADEVELKQYQSYNMSTKTTETIRLAETAGLAISVLSHARAVYVLCARTGTQPDSFSNPFELLFPFLQRDPSTVSY